MPRQSRRTVVALLCGGIGSLAGCLEAGGTSGAARLEAVPGNLESVPNGEPVAVFTPTLRDWIGSAAQNGLEVRAQTRPESYDVRAHEIHSGPFYPLDDLDAAAVVEEAGDAAWTCRIEATAGSGDSDLYATSEVDSVPDGETAIEVDDLAEPKRDLVLAALDANPYGSETIVMASSPDVFDWADDHLVGSPVEHEGRYHRIDPIHPQTPGYPPSHYFLRFRAEEADVTDPIQLVLADPSESVRDSIARAMSNGESDDPLDDAVAFAEAYPYVLTFSTVWQLSTH